MNRSLAWVLVGLVGGLLVVVVWESFWLFRIAKVLEYMALYG
jgi:hypothetical protein